MGAGVVLTGGGAKLKHIDLLFKNYTGLDVRVAGAESNLEEESLNLAGDPAIATAIGLLIRAYNEPGQSKTANRARPLTPRSVNDETSPSGNKRSLNDFYQTQNTNTIQEENPDEDQQPPTPPAPKTENSVKRFFNKLRTYFEEDEIEDNEI